MSEYAFDHCWRWFGPRDPVGLVDARQAGATGIVTALHQVPVGHVWNKEAILERKNAVESAGFRWVVAESVPVHDDIKFDRPGSRDKVENFKRSLRNLASAGVRTVCYNFIPLLDWSRTDISAPFGDGSTTTRFDMDALAAFDLFILKRTNAEKVYSDEEKGRAERIYDSLTDEKKRSLERSVLLGFPGSGEGYTLDSLREAFSSIPALDAEEYRAHLLSFLDAIVPCAEECGILLALHPDDPPWSLFGLPRAASTREDLRAVLQSHPSRHNGLTFCTGSLGASVGNDVPAMAEEFAERVHFLHLRNVRRSGPKDFIESNHLEGDVDMFRVVRTFVLEQRRRSNRSPSHPQLPMRPDHGHLMSADERGRTSYPGYSLIGRMRGLSELKGLEMGIVRGLD